MARIFISHSSRNDAEAVALRDWLIREGWNDLFLDLDPQHGIVAGERWERALHDAANHCEVVLFLISRPWLDSHWCRREFNLAQKLNKRLIGLLIEEIPIADLPPEITGTWQLVNLAAGADHVLLRAILPGGSEAHTTFSTSGLARLRAGLTKAGLDARFFEWPPDDEPNRPPYRGLLPLEAEDAGIFFGREASIIDVLDRLRGLREARSFAFFVILGASGSGKSSFLRAGLLPRLRRDDRHFLPLPIVRPEQAVLSGESGILRCLEAALRVAGPKWSRAQIRASIAAGPEAVAEVFSDIAEAFRPPDLVSDEPLPPPTLVLAIDQAEELFAPEGAAEADSFLRIIRGLELNEGLSLIVLATIRSDAFEQMQTAPALEGLLTHTFSLPALPKGAYQAVIEGPANRLRDTPRALAIQPALTDALMADIETGGGKDALPLLAFSLERLYLEHGGDGDLRLSEYQAIGGMRGSIEAAVEQALKAADSDPAIPADRAARLTLLRRALIPWLAGIDLETGAPRRRVARYSEIPEESRPLVAHLIDARLLATDISPETGERTVEPAHESLLRQWGLLQGWLEEDLAALTTLEGIQRAVRDWAANGRDEDWLAHTGGRLDDAESLRQTTEFGHFLNATDLEYLKVCRSAEDDRRNRELEDARQLAAAQRNAAERQRQVARRTRIGLVVASLLAVTAMGLAKIASDEATEAEEQKATALRNDSVSLAALSGAELKQERFVAAAQLALAAWPREGDTGRPPLTLALAALSEALPRLRDPLRAAAYRETTHAAISPDGSLLVLMSDHDMAPDGGVGWLFDTATGTQLAEVTGSVAAFSQDNRFVLTGSRTGTVRVWDTAGTEVPVVETSAGVSSVAASPDGSRMVAVMNGWYAGVYETASGVQEHVYNDHDDRINSAVFSPDGQRIVTASRDGTVRIWDAASGEEDLVIRPDHSFVYAASFSPDGTRIVTAAGATAQVWDSESGEEIASLKGHDAHVTAAAISPDSVRVATASADGTLRVWNIATGVQERAHQSSKGTVYSIGFSADGADLLVASSDSAKRLLAKLEPQLVTVLTGQEALDYLGDESPAVRKLTRLEGPVRKLESLSLGSVPEASTIPATLSYNGEYRAILLDGGVVKVSDTSTDKQVATLIGHQGDLTAIDVHRKDERIVTGSRDGLLRIFDSSVGVMIATLTQPEWVGSTYFQDEHTLVTVNDAYRGSDAIVRIWNVSNLERGDAFSIACNRLHRNRDLTPVRARYDLDDITPICAEHQPVRIAAKETVLVLPSQPWTRLSGREVIQ